MCPILIDVPAKEIISELKLKIDSQNTKLHIQEQEMLQLRLQLDLLTEENHDLYFFSTPCYFTIDEKYLIHNVNFNAAHFFGIDRRWILNKLFLNFVSYNSQNTFQMKIKSLISTQIKQSFEIEVLLKNKERKQVSINAVLLRNKLIRISFEDVSYIRQLKMQIFELKKSLDLADNLFEHTQDALASMDRKFNVQLVNRAFIGLFSKIFALKIQVGMNISIILDDFSELKTNILNLIQKAILDGRASLLFENHSHDRQLYYCYELVITSSCDEFSQDNQLILHIRNLTEHKLDVRRQLEQQANLALASRATIMGEMASAFAHEINQPLTAIITYNRSCFNLIKNLSVIVNNKLMFPIEQIAIQTDHIIKVIDNMKVFINTINFHVEEENINDVIIDTLAIFKYELSDFKLKITLNLTKVSNSLINRTHIMQVILNLARNSIEALKNVPNIKSELVIRTHESDTHVIVDIIDNGPGIPAIFKHKILNEYFTTKSQGTGIGLGICRSLIEAHGGKLSFHEQSSGKGAWFTFTLPIRLLRKLY